ncbi:hypothetical protein AB0J38_41035 [Streptomyces sp. NPDC050095]|uniref:hypothetical protein n=1 Tax=unclassified Streptomyces TaxID=2593676 RepID=UPI00343F5375
MMVYRCTSLQPLNDVMALFSLEIAPFDAQDIDYKPGAVMQCQLGEGDHDTHGSFLRILPGANGKEVWLSWDGDHGNQYVSIVKLCMEKRRGDADGGCLLYKGHPGECDWAILDPVDVALTAKIDQACALFDDWLRSTRGE